MTGRPVQCCGKCPPIWGGGYDCTCEGNPRCSRNSPEDERITAWRTIVKHPFFLECYDDGPILINAMLRRLDKAQAVAEALKAPGIGTGYTPTTEQVRNNMAFGAACASYAKRTPDPEMEKLLRDIDWPIPGLRPGIKAQFDRWLAGELAKARQEALEKAHDREERSG